MNLLAYKNLIKNHAKPTEWQTTHFIEFVARDHSWYKHLPRKREVPFQFYLDPNAGKKVERITKESFFKKTVSYRFAVTPNDHQSSYGLWQYYTERYTVKHMLDSDGFLADARPLIGLNLINEHWQYESLPDEIIERGQFMMSAFLHRPAFKNCHNYFDDNGVSFAENHRLLMEELRKQLDDFIEFVYAD